MISRAAPVVGMFRNAFRQAWEAGLKVYIKWFEPPEETAGKPQLAQAESENKEQNK